MKRPWASLTAISFVLAAATSVVPAAAQEAQVTVTTPAPQPAPEGASKKEERKEEEKDSAHFRFGLGLDGDFFLSPGNASIKGLGVGVQLRLGAQINQWFATYYQAHAIVGGTVSSAGAASSATLIGTVFNSVLAEATLPVLHIGAGPSVDVLGVKGYALEGGETGATSVFFGIEGRAAIVIGGHGPGRHGGFAINANVHPTFWNGIVLSTFSLGIGGEMY